MVKTLAYRMTVDRVEGDQDFTIAVESPEAAMDLIRQTIKLGYIVRPTENIAGETKVEVVPLHRIKVFEIFKKKD